jgi:hypothetical protein
MKSAKMLFTGDERTWMLWLLKTSRDLYEQLATQAGEENRSLDRLKFMQQQVLADNWWHKFNKARGCDE